MASRRRKPNPSEPRGVSATPATTAGEFLPTLEEFVIHGDGQIAIGTIKPIACAAIANDAHNMLAALVRRPDETLQQLLERLDRAVRLALDDQTYTDEINTPLPPSRR
ncbi:MAG: hypothetical protein ACOZDY_19430 [Pseudomonadota bacterium]